MDTLKAARKELLVKGRKGTNCPCCGQHVQLYKRKFNTVMARGLISLFHLTNKVNGNFSYHHVSDIMTKISPTGSNDFSKLRYHGFIEEEVNSNPAKRTSGYWRITVDGIYFVKKLMKVKSYLLIYNKRLIGKEGDPIDIEQALGKKFHYAELMNQI